MQAITIGLDIAKSVFQVHIESGDGRILLQKKLHRAQVEPFFAKHPKALVGIEACGTAHYWGRVLRAMGHEVRLIPAAYVKPFVRRNKNDARDAAAICAAMGRPDMRFVTIKSEAQQAARALERSRDLLVRQSTQLSNSLRSQMAEFGLISAQGREGFAKLRAAIAAADPRLPPVLVVALEALLTQLDGLAGTIAALTKQIETAAKADPVMRRLCTVPGVGPLTAHAVVAAVGDGSQFRTARDFAAWTGLTPRQHESADKGSDRGLSRQGDRHLRKLFALGASTVMRGARRPQGGTAWQRGILARRPVKVAVLAQAAKTARVVWAVLTSGAPYRPQHQTAQTLSLAGA